MDSFNTTMPERVYDYERTKTGDLKIEVVYLPLLECEFTFYTVDGEETTFGSGEIIRTHSFIINHPSINETHVRNIHLEMGYSVNDLALIRVEMYVPIKVERS